MRNAIAAALAPTPAPSPTTGPPVPVKEFDGPFLEKELDMEEAAQIAFDYDQKNAVWNKPWNVKGINKKNGRIKVESFSDRSFDGSDYGPGVENGPVWVITIKGKVTMTGLGSDSRTHGSVSYIIAKRTGHLLGWRTGP